MRDEKSRDKREKEEGRETAGEEVAEPAVISEEAEETNKGTSW